VADYVGSGFFYQGRFIVTNQHVIDNSKDGPVPFRLLDGRSGKAKIIGQDEKMDVAVLEIDPKDFGLETMPSAQISPEPAKAGESIIAIGNPLGELEWSTTLGIVSSVNRHQEKANRDFLQIDAAINAGNSGGPAFNMAGDVVGMNTLKTDGAEGIALSIEGHTLQSVVDKMIQEHAQKNPR
jgi:serine protease Do